MTPYQLKQLLNQLSGLDLRFLCYDLLPPLYQRATQQTPAATMRAWLLAETPPPPALLRRLQADYPARYALCLGMRPRNPFVIGSYLHQPEQFFGRKRLLRELQSILKGFQSVALVGEHRMGRSSVLYNLYATRRRWAPPGVQVAYVDLQMVWGEEDFFPIILERLQVTPPHDRTQFRRHISANPVILLLDDIEFLADNDDFNPRLQSYLRGFGSMPHFAMCIASKLPLLDLFPDKRGRKISPFHNIFINKTLPPFSSTELLSLLQSRLQNSGIEFSPAEISDLIEQCHGSPARLQERAYNLFAQKLREQYD